MALSGRGNTMLGRIRPAAYRPDGQVCARSHAKEGGPAREIPWKPAKVSRALQRSPGSFEGMIGMKPEGCHGGSGTALLAANGNALGHPGMGIKGPQGFCSGCLARKCTLKEDLQDTLSSLERD